MKKNNTTLKNALIACASIVLLSFTAKAPFAPMKVMIIKHRVADFDKWKPAFDAHASKRKEYGQTDLDLLRRIENPNDVLIVEQISDVQKAKDFTTLPDLKEKMQQAGVTGAPEFEYYDVIRNDDSKISTKERIMVTHKVKDFDAWLKVYDSEGKSTRASQGMVDRVLARGIDDPNLVHIVFAVTDMNKAVAAINSEAKKKLMTSAGVEGKPSIEYYKQAK
jgi:hypothetical protein